jgi:hypothetical protein
MVITAGILTHFCCKKIQIKKSTCECNRVNEKLSKNAINFILNYD